MRLLKDGRTLDCLLEAGYPHRYVAQPTKSRTGQAAPASRELTRGLRRVAQVLLEGWTMQAA